ncbi:MAG: hypothetical protein IJ191_00105 [Treponema sp.]|nr:hypothetical protein [Treponema sp.]
MNKTIGFLRAAVAGLALLTVGCKTTSVARSSAKNVNRPAVTIIDYQGSAFSSEIPQWVQLVAQGEYSSKALSKVMPDLDNKKAFVTIAQGDNLEFTKQWTDVVDIEVQVGDTMQRVVGKTVSASESARSNDDGSGISDTEVNRTLNMYKEAVSTVEVNGLEKVASYWVLKEVKQNNKTTQSYEYYAVWAMDADRYDRQIDAALRNIRENTSEGQALKQTLREKLMSLVISSNNETVEDNAYNWYD